MHSWEVSPAQITQVKQRTITYNNTGYVLPKIIKEFLNLFFCRMIIGLVGIKFTNLMLGNYHIQWLASLAMCRSCNLIAV